MKILISTAIGMLSIFAFAKPAFAHCPLCVAGAGAGLSLSRFLGINDAITGVWMAAFTGAIAFWSANIIKIKIPAKQTIGGCKKNWTITL